MRVETLTKNDPLILSKRRLVVCLAVVRFIERQPQKNNTILERVIFLDLTKSELYELQAAVNMAMQELEEGEYKHFLQDLEKKIAAAFAAKGKQ